jgi:hypothetical protein
MPEATVSTFGGINTYQNPFLLPDGNIIHSVNMDSVPFGAKRKRSGYTTYLGTPDNSTVNSLFTWQKNDGSTFFNYRASGSTLYYSAQGTGAWTVAGNGTIGNGAHVMSAVLDNTLFIVDGVGSTRHSTDGTSFTNTSGAPIGVDVAEYQNRIYVAGTSSSLFYSTSGTGTDWITDSTSLFIPSDGKLSRIYKASDRLLSVKNSGLMYRWDGDTLIDMATRLGPSSPYSMGTVEDYRFWMNRLGIFTSNAGAPQLVSNTIQNQIYNDSGSSIIGTSFNSAPGGVYRYNYFLAAGTLTDDFTGITIPDSLIKYDYQKNEFSNYRFSNFPTSFTSYKDVNGVDQFIFGDQTGQVYQLSGTSKTDNGSGIESSLVLIVHANSPQQMKDFRRIEFFTNPGCGARVRCSFSDATEIFNPFNREGPQIWKELCDLHAGHTQVDFPPDSRGTLMYLQFYDNGSNDRFNLYSFTYQYDLVNK